MIEFEIRPSRISDAESMIALLNPLIEEGKFTTMESILTIETQREWITHVHKCGLEFVAESDSREIIGMQSVEQWKDDPTVGDISTFVHTNYRGLGVGKALSALVLPTAKARGFRKLLARVRLDNAIALSYYKSIRFQKSGVWNRAGTTGESWFLAHLEYFLDDELENSCKGQ